MLASPFLPSPMFSSQINSDDFRPSKDVDAFNSLLPPPIDFVEGSSSGTLAVAEGKYEPINSSPKPVTKEIHDTPKTAPSSPKKAVPSSSRHPSAKVTSLHPSAVDLTWPLTCNRGTGLYNNGNTCFLNSALQCLMHTPPLLKLLISHRKDECHFNTGFCMCCSLRQVSIKAHTGEGAFSPNSISNNLQVIAKHMRKGRQEDTHEFLRYAIDALQKSCLAGLPPKHDLKIAETTWVHKIFGGRLRSQVTCRDCGHDSDTFDRILDLSLDIYRCDSLRDALRKFIAIDYLKGADKYKCEKCKKHVNAEKRFTVHEAPLVLTVHLKRFSPLGRKISHPVQYDEDLSLHPYMSEGQFGPTYSLYGVICHAGGGPNSGHYYSYVRSKDGRWWEMNDELVQTSGTPTDKKNAYMLFYIQNKGQGLEAAVKGSSLYKPSSVPIKNGLAAAMKKRIPKIIKDLGEEDTGIKVQTTFIGPLLPSPNIGNIAIPIIPPPTSPLDPQALSLKSKIMAVAKQEARKALDVLEDYNSDDADKETKSSPEQDPPREEPTPKTINGASGHSVVPGTSKQSSPPVTSPVARLAVPVTSFYASSNRSKKRKHMDDSIENQPFGMKPLSSLQSRTNGYVSSNPFNRTMTMKKSRMGI